MGHDFFYYYNKEKQGVWRLNRNTFSTWNFLIHSTFIKGAFFQRPDIHELHTSILFIFFPQCAKNSRSLNCLLSWDLL